MQQYQGTSARLSGLKSILRRNLKFHAVEQADCVDVRCVTLLGPSAVMWAVVACPGHVSDHDVGSQRRVGAVYHAAVTLSRAESRAMRVLMLFCAESSTLLRCFRWGGRRRLHSAWADCRGAAEPSHNSTNQGNHRHRLRGRYSLRSLGGAASRSTSRAYAALSGRSPLSSQYPSPEPIRCLLNASRADMHWLAILAEPFCRAHSLGYPFGKHL